MKNSMQKPEYTGRNTGTGSKIHIMLLAVCCLVFAVSSAGAASKNLTDILKAYIKDNYPWTEVDISDVASNYALPDIMPENIMVVRGLPGRTVFQLEFKDGKRITATADVKAFDRVVLSRRSLNKGYHLREDDVYTSLMDIRRIPKGALRDGYSITGRELTRPIPANTPLSDNLVSETPVLKKGHRVVLKIESPGFSAATIGEIKENSYVGNYVKVVNVASKKIVTGLLVDENTVKVGL